MSGIDMEDAAWSVIVQHLQHPQEICSLLCVSKGLQSLIHSRCQGQLRLRFDAASLEQQQHFAGWLAVNSSLLSRALALKLWRQLPRLYSAFIQHDAANYADKEVPEGTGLPGQPSNKSHCSNIQSAEDSAFTESSNETCPSGIPVYQDLQTQQQQQHENQQQLAVAAAAAVLQRLPTHITHLELHCDYYQSLASNPTVLAAIEGLTNLQYLNLDSSVTVCSASVFEALSGFSSLKTLVLNRVICVSKLRHLPACLEHLDLGICSPGLQLSHLTSLTSLRSRDRFLPIQPNDFLPPNLQQLVVGECHSVQRLVQLTNLKSLDMAASNLPARRLRRLATNLKALTEVKLSYHSGFNEAAAAWSELPLRHLSIVSDTAAPAAAGDDGVSGDQHRTAISAATVQALSSLTGLTYLHIQHLDALEATKQQLAAVIQELSALQGLKLWAAGPWPLLRDDAQQQQQQQHQQVLPAISITASTSSSSSSCRAAAAAAGGSDWPSSPGSISVMHAIAALPNLTTLSLSLQNLGQAAAAQLAAATKLTSLKLRACGVGDPTLEYLAQHLTGLRSLFAEYNRDISDGVLAAVEKSLLELTELDIRYTGVSDGGKQYLHTLHRLKQLQV